jgi:hypothetical protein
MNVRLGHRGNAEPIFRRQFPSLANAPFCNPWLLGILKSRDILPPLAGEVASASSALMQIAIGEGFVLVPEQISRISTPGVVFRPVLDLRDRYDFSFAWKQGHETVSPHYVSQFRTKPAMITSNNGREFDCFFG